MLVSGNIPVTPYQEFASQKISTLGTREISGYASIVQEKKKQKAKIKYRKIKTSDCIIAPDGLPLEYYSSEEGIKHSIIKSVKQYLNFLPDKKQEGNFFLSGVIDEEREQKYFNNCYLLANIESPTPHEGAGTEAMQSLVEKSMLDDDTGGRVILYMVQLSDEDTSPKFFYKLGFRYIDEDNNTAMKEFIDKNIFEFRMPSGYMYLPKENIQKLLRYGHLF